MLVISSTGAARIKRDGIQRNIYLFLRRKYYADMYQMELQVMDSGLDVTVLRAPYLVDEGAPGKYHVIEDETYPVGINITRSNLAKFLVDELEDRQWNNRVIAVAAD